MPGSQKTANPTMPIGATENEESNDMVSELSETSSQILNQRLIDETILQLFELTARQGNDASRSPKQVRVEEAILSLFELNFGKGSEVRQVPRVPSKDLILSKDGELKEISQRIKTKISALDKQVEAAQKKAQRLTDKHEAEYNEEGKDSPRLRKLQVLIQKTNRVVAKLKMKQYQARNK